MAQVTDLKKLCARNARRDEFAKQICAKIALQFLLGSDSRHSRFYKNFVQALHFLQTYDIIKPSKTILLEKK